MDSKYGQLYTQEDLEQIVNATLEDCSVTASEGQLTSIVSGLQGSGSLHFPPDEPLFLIRGKDKAAVDALLGYESASRQVGAGTVHLGSVIDAVEQFGAFADANADKMKVPD